MLLKNINKCLTLNPDFSYDEACIDIFNNKSEPISIWGQYTECHNCDIQDLAPLDPKTNTSILITTRFPLQLFYKLADNFTYCNINRRLLEHYRYGWNITDKDCSNLYIKEAADNAYLPILSAFIILFCFGTIWYMVKCIYKNSVRIRSLLQWNSEVENDLGSSSTPLVVERGPSIRKHPHRIKSVDVFRGFCIIVMIFVNYGGGRYWFFTHSAWNGLTFADLVFPWFLWLMGVSFSISLQAKLRNAMPRREMVIQVLRRSFVLILLGIVINSHKNLSTISMLRFPGVLQRFGVAYLIVGLLEITFAKRSEIESFGYFADISTAWPQWIIVTILTAINLFVTFLLNVPGCGKGYLGPGGLDEHGKFTNCTGGAAGYIDRVIFGNHMYKHPACQKLYETTLPYDPEGLLGTLTSVLVVYFGVQAGRTLNTYQDVKAKVLRWLLWGFLTCLLGGALCEFKKNDGLIPLNKQLWSLSFVLVLSGLGFIVLACLFVLVDITRKWGGRPFFYPGMNAIILYVGHELFMNTFPFAWTPTTDTHGSYLFMNLWGTGVWVVIAIFLYKRNIFFTL